MKLLLTATLGALPLVAAGQGPTLADVLGRATDYVTILNEQLQGIVAEEQYEQRASSRDLAVAGLSFIRERRSLRSDYLLIRPEGSQRHYGFRDVFEVNGRTVRDREDRLATLFLDGARTTDEQIQGILAESARHNVGDVERNINTPTLALLFLHPSYTLRFDFSHVPNVGSPPLGLDRPDGDVWMVQYAETWHTTVVSGRRGQNMPARGHYWIEPDSGRVVASELTFESTDFTATIAVRYGQPDTLDHLVPVEMRERYRTEAGSRIEGTATYSSFRRFRVEVDEGRR